MLRSLRRVATIRRLNRIIRSMEGELNIRQGRIRALERSVRDLRLQLEQERGWRYDMPAGKAAARMEMLRESGRVEPVAP